LTHHQNKVAKAKKKKKSKGQAKTVDVTLTDKDFGSLTGGEKDDLLKIIALELNLIAPDP
jgi:hypothetical protein